MLLTPAVFAETWNLQRTVREAVAQSPTLEVTRRDLVSREFDVVVARSAILPQLSLSASHGIAGTDPWSVTPYATEPTATQPVSNASLLLSETLYNNGLNGMKRDMAAKRLDLAKLNYDVARDRLVLEVMDKYYKYSLAEALEDVQQTQLNLLRRQFNTISTQYNQGVKTRRDFLRFKAEVRRSEIELLTAKSSVTRAQTDVLKTVGLATGASENVQLQPVPVELDSIKKPAKGESAALIPAANHREAKALAFERELAEDDFAVLKRTNGFEITWTAEAGYGSKDYWRTGRTFDENKGGNWNTLINFKWTLWDWGAKNATVSIAAEARSQALATARGKSLELESQLLGLQLELNQGYQNFILSEELLDLELANSDAIAADFRNGRVNYLDLTTSLTALLRARQGLYSSFFDLKTSLARQSYHEATIYEEFAEK